MRAAPPTIEQQILVCCARARMAPTGVDALRSLVNLGVDWDALLAQAARHGLRPLVSHHLRHAAPELIPGPVLQRLDAVSAGATANALRAVATLFAILQALDDDGIVAVPFKGPVLGAVVYGSPGLREFGDLDLLASRGDLARIRRCLEARGYRVPPDHARKLDGPHPERAYHYQFVSPAPDHALVEVHLEPTVWAFGIPWQVEALLDAAEPTVVAGRSIRSLARRHLVILLCLNATKDGWTRLEQVAAIAELILMPELEWPEVFAEAERLGVRRIVCVGIQLAERLLAAAPPPWVRDMSRRDRTARMVATRLAHRFFQPSRVPRRMRLYALRLLLRDRVRDSLRYCLRDVVEALGEPNLAGRREGR